MAIHTKVGILTHVPGSSASVTPGLIDGIYADFLTKEFDFLDDARNYPHNDLFTKDAWETTHYTHDWEDVGTTYRAWRDEYQKDANEYWLARSHRTTFQYKNFVQDPGGANPLEIIRLVYPAPNGDFNIPYPNPKGSEGYPLYTPSRPLLHNMTRLTLPLLDMGFSCANASDASENLENTQYVRDNQAAIDAKQVEIDLANINGTDTTQLQSDLDNLYNNSQWIEPDTMSNRKMQYRRNRDCYCKAMNELALRGNRSRESVLNSQSGWVNGVYKESLNEEDFVIIKNQFLNHDFSVDNPNPWNDERFSFAWGDGQNPVAGAYNNTIHNMFGDGNGSNTLTNHPAGTLPSDVLPGVTKINWLQSVLSTDLMPTTGNPGDVIEVTNYDYFAWDPQNAEWSTGFYHRFLNPFITRMDDIRNAKLKAKNELALAMNPFLFAALHIPAFSLTTSTDIVK